MRIKIFIVAAVLALGGCNAATDGSETTGPSVSVTAPASETPNPAGERTPTEEQSPTEEPSVDPAQLPSDVKTVDDGEFVTYTFASRELTLTLPSTWVDLVDSSQAFPIAVENPSGTQRIVVAEIGPSRLTPDPEPYRQLLVEKLGVDDEQVTYIGVGHAGLTYPAFEINADGYVAWIFLVTADERLFELTVKADSYDEGVAALNQITTLTNAAK